LSLYFALLATSLLAYAAIPDEVQMELVTEAVDSVLVFAWAAAAWPSVSRGLKTLPSGRSLLLAMGLGGLSFALASAAVHFLTNALGIESIRYVEPLQDAGFGFAVVLLVICIQPAVIEELAFRGVILESLESILDPREAIIVSALLFMVLHLAVPSFPHLFIMGLLLGVLRRRTGSLYPCMALHFTHNSLCVLTEALGWW
jgi:membrane protease YdiL (CAAX protease family)